MVLLHWLLGPVLQNIASGYPHDSHSLRIRATVEEYWDIPGPPPDPVFDEGAGPYNIEKPTAEDIQFYNDWKEKADLAVSLGFPNAARHMYHFLENTGSDLIFSTDHMMFDFGPVAGLQSAVEDIVKVQAEQAFRKAAVGEGSKATFQTPWQASHTTWGFHLDWFLAIGGFSWSVAGVVDASRVSGEYTSTVRYVVYAVDRYNWDTGKGLLEGLLANDEDLQRLHRVGLAREYNERGSSKVYKIEGYNPDSWKFRYFFPGPPVEPYNPLACLKEKCPWMADIVPYSREAKDSWIFHVRNDVGALIWSESPQKIDTLGSRSGLVTNSDKKKTVNTRCIDVEETAGQQGNNEASMPFKDRLPASLSYYFGYDDNEDLSGKATDMCTLVLFDSKGCTQRSGTPKVINGVWADNLPYDVRSFKVSKCQLLA